MKMRFSVFFLSAMIYSLLEVTSCLQPTQALDDSAKTKAVQTSSQRIRGRAKRRFGGGKLGVCDDSQPIDLTAIVPQDGDDKTSKPNPTFLFFIPDKENSKIKATFYLQFERKDVEPSPVSITIRNTPGIVRHTVSSTLEAGKTYKWRLEVSCGRGRNQSVYGQLIYTPLKPDLQKKLDKEKSNPKAIVEIYRQSGFYLDSISAASDLSTSEPQFWNKQLQDLALPELVDNKIIR
jgi:Domain of Unknown Function (DUF928)